VDGNVSLWGSSEEDDLLGFVVEVVDTESGDIRRRVFVIESVRAVSTVSTISTVRSISVNSVVDIVATVVSLESVVGILVGFVVGNLVGVVVGAVAVGTVFLASETVGFDAVGSVFAVVATRSVADSVTVLLGGTMVSMTDIALEVAVTAGSVSDLSAGTAVLVVVVLLVLNIDRFVIETVTELVSAMAVTVLAVTMLRLAKTVIEATGEATVLRLVNVLVNGLVKTLGLVNGLVKTLGLVIGLVKTLGLVIGLVKTLGLVIGLDVAVTVLGLVIGFVKIMLDVVVTVLGLVIIVLEMTVIAKTVLAAKSAWAMKTLAAVRTVTKVSELFKTLLAAEIRVLELFELFKTELAAVGTVLKASKLCETVLTGSLIAIAWARFALDNTEGFVWFVVNFLLLLAVLKVAIAATFTSITVLTGSGTGLAKTLLAASVGINVMFLAVVLTVVATVAGNYVAVLRALGVARFNGVFSAVGLVSAISFKFHLAAKTVFAVKTTVMAAVAVATGTSNNNLLKTVFAVNTVIAMRADRVPVVFFVIRVVASLVAAVSAMTMATVSATRNDVAGIRAH